MTLRLFRPILRTVEAARARSGLDLIWFGLVAATLITRTVGLDTRGMSHDESLHALYSYYLSNSGEYVHNPMMHGPLLFHVNAAVYLLTGQVNDFTARLAPAIAGTLAVAGARLFRRYIGESGALAAGIVLFVSPSLSFYSRYIRNDIYIILCSLAWAYSLFRYVEGGRRQWIWTMAAAMGLGLAAKENHFITGLTMGTFSAGMAVWLALTRKRVAAQAAGRYADAAVTMLCLVLPFFASLVLAAFGMSPVPASEEEFWQAGAAAAGLGIAALAGGWLWMGVLKPRQLRGPFGYGDLLKVWLTFWTIVLLLYSAFLTNPSGLATGPASSLGYWLAQHEVQRGSQPWHYYPLLAGYYEYLALALGIWGAAAVVAGLVRWRRTAGEAGLGNSSPPPLLTQFQIFLLSWSVQSWLAYGFAGEKMPWLLGHMVVPLALLGANGLAVTVRGLNRKTRRILLAVLFGGFGLASLLLAGGFSPFAGREIPAARESSIWLALIIGGGLSAAWSIFEFRKIRPPYRAVFLIPALALCLLTARTSYLLSFRNFDSAEEYLVYAHASPDVKRLLGELESLGAATGQGNSIRIAYDHANSWPLAWYFRNYPNALLYDESDFGTAARGRAAFIARSGMPDSVLRQLGADYVYRRYRLIWWPEERYKGWNFEDWRNLLDRQHRQRFRDRFFHRRHSDLDLAAWPHRREFDFYVRRDLAPLIWESFEELGLPVEEPAAEPDLNLQLPLKFAITGSFDGLPLEQPRSVSMGLNGSRIITESAHHRVLILDRTNALIGILGGRCEMHATDLAGCSDPDGSGPLALGDGQMHEPWGAAQAADGTIAVADTWNHRIQVFSSDGEFIAKWGRFGRDPAPGAAGSDLFWGPRGLAFDRWNNIIVADTGNHRLLMFTTDGEWVATWQGQDTQLGYLQEPVGVSTDGADGILVADMWNGRLQHLSGEFQSKEAYRTPPSMWNSRHVLHKPYVAAIPGFGAVVSDPENARLVFFDQSGIAAAELDMDNLLRSEAPYRAIPLGLAVDHETAELLVADAGSDSILVFDLSSLHLGAAG